MNCISTKPPLPISIFSISLLDALIDDALETLPAALRHQDGVPVAALLLRDRHVPPLLVTLHLEVEILVLDLDMLLPGPGVVLIILRVHDAGVSVVVSPIRSSRLWWISLMPSAGMNTWNLPLPLLVTSESLRNRPLTFSFRSM